MFYRRLGFVIAPWIFPVVLSSQSLQITASPTDGYYPISWQISVHVDFCITDPNEHFFDEPTVTLNGSQVTTRNYGASYPCVDERVADSTLTLGSGTTNVTANANTYVGANVDVIYPWTASHNYTAPPPPPAVDVSVHNGHNRNLAMCALSCFNSTYSYSTPDYMTLSTERAATLFYSSSQVEAQHIVQFAATPQGEIKPDQITAKLKRPDGSLVTLSTGGTVASFVPADLATHRYAIQFEDTTLSTGAYDYTLVVGTVWPSTVTETSVPIRLLIINERSSPYGAGWSVAAIGRVIEGPGDSVATYDGTGTIQFWRRSGCVSNTCSYTAPAGEFDQLSMTWNVNNPPEKWFTRTLVDGTKLTYYSLAADRLISIQDVSGNTTRITWRSSINAIDSIVDPVGKAIVFGYDGNNRLASILDTPGNRTTSFTVNAQNNLSQIQDAVGGKPFQQGSYDSYHRLLARLDRGAFRWSYAYDGSGKLSSDSTPPITADSVIQRLVTHYRAPESAVLASSDSADIGTTIDASGTAHQVRIDVFGGVVFVLAPAAEFAQYTRNTDGQVSYALNSTDNSYYSWSGPRLIAVTNQITSSTIHYDWNTSSNRITHQYGGGAPEVRYYYDATGYRLDSMRVGTDTPAVRYTYDSRGRILTVRDQKGHLTEYFHSSTGLFTNDSARVGSIRVALTHDGMGRPTVKKDPANRTDSTTYDALNRIVRTARFGSAVTFRYDDSLNFTGVVDAAGQTFKMEKNAVGWDTARVDPNGKRDLYARDRSGRVIKWTNRQGQPTTFVYDASGRLIKRSLSDGRVVTRSYMPTWFADSSAEGRDTVRWAADTVYEIAVRGGVAHRVRRFFNATARYITIDVWRDGQGVTQVRYDLDTLGRVWQIRVPGSNLDTLRYTSDGLLSSVGLHGITTMTYMYRPQHNLATLQLSASQNDFGKNYAQDSLSRAAEMVLGGRSEFERYRYDSLDQLTSVERWGANPLCVTGDTLSEFGARCYGNRTQLATQEVFSYDLGGNRTDGSAVIGVGNRLLRFNGDTLLYDLDGNLLRRYRIVDSTVFNQRLFWNSAGQLDSARTVRQGQLQSVSFGYDLWGRRVRKTASGNTTYYMYDREHVVAEYDATGTLQRHYSYYPGTDNPHSVSIGGVRLYYISDARGSIRGLIGPWNGTLNIIYGRYRYTAFGNADSTYEFGITNNIRFAGRELDPETGLYYDRARYYDPQLGRFISEDPTGISGGLNSYAYAQNDPVNFRDPTGHEALVEVAAVGVLALAIVATTATPQFRENAIQFGKTTMTAIRSVLTSISIFFGGGHHGPEIEPPNHDKEPIPYVQPPAPPPPPPPPPPPFPPFGPGGPGVGGGGTGPFGGLGGGGLGGAGVWSCEYNAILVKVDGAWQWVATEFVGCELAS